MNYYILRQKLRNINCIYIDTNQHLADKIFIEHKLKMKFMSDFQNKVNNYEVILVEFPKKKLPTFIECMQELENKLLILGYSDYPAECKELIRLLKEETGNE